MKSSAGNSIQNSSNSLTDSIKCWQGCRGAGTLNSYAVGMQSGEITLENGLAVSYKVKPFPCHMIRQSNPTPRYLSKKDENTSTQKLVLNIHNSP